MFTLITIILLLVSGVQAMTTAELESFRKRLEPFTQKGRFEANFTQTRHFSAIGFDMKVQGKMLVEANKSIQWDVTSPTQSKLTLTSSYCKMWESVTNKTITMNAKEHQWIATIFRLQDNWFKGDLDELQKEFELSLENERTLSMKPKTKKFENLFKRVSIEFSEKFDDIKQICFVEKSNDTLTLDFKH